MKKNISIFVIAWMLLAVVSADAIAQTKPKRRQAAQVAPVVCAENDQDCFIQAAETCRKANITFSGGIKWFGMLETSGTSYREIRGGRGGNCTIYFKTIKNDVKFTEEFIQKMKARGHTQEEINEAELKANESADSTEGTDGVCTFKTAKLVALLRKWKSGESSSDDWKGGNCRGTMFDRML